MIKAMAAAAIGGGLVLLCACATQVHAPAAPTHQPPAATTADPNSTALHISTDAPSPSPTPDIGPPGAPLTRSLIVTDSDAPVADLAVIVSGPAQVTLGDTGTYTLTIRNYGPSPATGIVLTNVLPHGIYPVWTEPGRLLCGRQERGVGCDLGELQPGTALTITLDLSVGGSETLVTSTQLAGVIVDLPVPSCVMGENRMHPHVTCSLSRLLPGASVQVRVGVETDTELVGPLVHTAAVYAAGTDEDYANNYAVFTSTLIAGGPAPVGAEGPETATLLTPTSNLVLYASSPSTVVAGLPFTYAYTITNAGTADVINVRFENAVPPATTLNGYSPGPAPCEWQEDSITCTMSDLITGDSIIVTLVATGHSGQSLVMWLDPLMPGWPMCYLLKEREYLHIVTCELGGLRTGQSIHVRVGFTAMGIQERLMVNSASVRALEAGLSTLTNTNTTTITVLARADLAVWSDFNGLAPESGTFTYTLTTTNLGPSDAANVLLTDTLPIGMILDSARPSLGVDCTLGPDDAEPGTLVCRAGHLSSRETITVTVVIAVGDSLVLQSTENVFHSARVTADQVDPDPYNNELTEYIPISEGSRD